jgi:hypothetical protein
MIHDHSVVGLTRIQRYFTAAIHIHGVRSHLCGERVARTVRLLADNRARAIEKETRQAWRGY